MQHPVAGAEELIGADDTHRHDRGAKFLRHIKGGFLEFLNVTVAGPRSFCESNQADPGIESLFCSLRHLLQPFAACLIRHRDVSKATQQPTVDWNPEM